MSNSNALTERQKSTARWLASLGKGSLDRLAILEQAELSGAEYDTLIKLLAEGGAVLVIPDPSHATSGRVEIQPQIQQFVQQIDGLESPMRKVFISHAQADMPVVEEFVRFIRAVHDLGQHDVFCSGIDGLGIPNGERFAPYIQAKLTEAPIAILLLSPNYMASKFCNNELGAVLVLAKTVFFLLIPPAKFSDMEAMIQGFQAEKIDDESHLAKFRDSLDAALSNDSKSTAVWQSECRIFLVKLAESLKKVKPPAIVELAMYDALQRELSEARTALDESTNDKHKLSEKLEQVEKLKNKSEVLEIELAQSDEWKQFETHCNQVKEQLRGVSNIVRELFFRDYAGGELDESRFHDRQIQEEIDNGYLMRAGGELQVNLGDPTVKELHDSIRDLWIFIDKKCTSTVAEKFCEMYKLELTMKNKRFWNQCLGFGQSLWRS